MASLTTHRARCRNLPINPIDAIRVRPPATILGQKIVVSDLSKTLTRHVKFLCSTSKEESDEGHPERKSETITKALYLHGLLVSPA